MKGLILRVPGPLSIKTKSLINQIRRILSVISKVEAYFNANNYLQAARSPLGVRSTVSLREFGGTGCSGALSFGL